MSEKMSEQLMQVALEEGELGGTPSEVRAIEFAYEAGLNHGGDDLARWKDAILPIAERNAWTLGKVTETLRAVRVEDPDRVRIAAFNAALCLLAEHDTVMKALRPSPSGSDEP